MFTTVVRSNVFMLAPMSVIVLTTLLSFSVKSDVDASTDVIAVSESNPWSLVVDSKDGVKRLDEILENTSVVSFFFTSCSTACPVQTAKLKNVQKSLPDSVKDQTQFLSVSINPASDSIEAVDSYAKKFGIDQSHWDFVVPQDSEALNTFLSAIHLETKPSEVDEIDHAMIVYLVKDKKIVHRYAGHTFRESQLIQDLIYSTSNSSTNNS